MNIIRIPDDIHQLPAGTWRGYSLATPEEAAMTCLQEYGVKPETCYVQRRTVYIPVTWSEEQHWNVIENRA